jgi:histidine triad (HIT) family protein
MCLFCNIKNGDIPCKKILENDEFLCFEDISPQSLIHVLIIPKMHIDSFSDVSSNIMGQMSEFIQEVAINLGVKSDGYRLITNIGKNGCQEVKHLHFHLLAGESIGALRSK